MYGLPFRSEIYIKRYRELARWFLEHQDLKEYTMAAIEDLTSEINVAIDSWMDKKDPHNG